MLGAEHPDTLRSMGNLASTYQFQGRWKEAEALDVQVKETRLKVLGAADEHGELRVDILVSRAVEGGGDPGRSSNGGLSQNARARTSRYIHEHGEPRVDIQESRTMEGGGGSGGSNKRGSSQSARARTSTYIEGHGEPHVDIQGSRMAEGGEGAGSK